MPADFMDSLALFTQGEFRCEPNDDPELLLYTHGEFPRVSDGGVAVAEPPAEVIGGRGSSADDDWDYYNLTPEEIAIVLLMMDDD